MLYQQKHYARDDNQVEELRESEEECEASDKDGWQIDMPDGDEIDDIEDSQCPRNRQGEVAKDGFQGEQGVIFMQ